MSNKPTRNDTLKDRLAKLAGISPDTAERVWPVR